MKSKKMLNYCLFLDGICTKNNNSGNKISKNMHVST